MKKFFLLMLAFTFCSLSAQGVDWNLTGAGSRAMGMGGAFIGLADDATAISWNPAGLYQLERLEASVVTQYYSEDYELDGGFVTMEQGNDTFVLNFASAAFPISMGNSSITTALAYQRQIEVFDYTEGETWSEETKGAASTVNIGAGSRLMNIFAVGFAANIWMGSYKYTYEETFYPTEETSGDFSGFNMGLGGMVDLNYLQNPIPLKMGVSYKTPFELAIDEEYGESTIEMPSMLGLGLSYRLGEFLTISFDFETKAYKDKMIKYVDDEDPSSNYDDIISLENLDQFRIGGEYLFVSDFAVIPIRMGFQNVPTTVFTPVNDQVLGNGFSFGTGMIFERFAIDLFTYFAVSEADFGYANFVQERLRAGVSGIFYF